VHNNLGLIVIYAGKLHAYSHYHVLMTRSIWSGS